MHFKFYYRLPSYYLKWLLQFTLPPMGTSVSSPILDVSQLFSFAQSGCCLVVALVCMRLFVDSDSFSLTPVA